LPTDAPECFIDEEAKKMFLSPRQLGFGLGKKGFAHPYKGGMG